MTVEKGIVTFESVNEGDELPELVKTETQETIDLYTRAIVGRRPRQFESNNLHTDQKFADDGIFKGTVNYGVVTAGFMMELLGKAFPFDSVQSCSLSMRALEPVRSDDTVTFGGKVLDKRIEADRKLVDVEITGVNQLGQVVAAAKATIPL
ncbi:MAG: MaoC family dehydratase [Chloroflexota bacterium]|nr:MaoC family dehydratase [Chloroflexota bacterium]